MDSLNHIQTSKAFQHGEYLVLPFPLSLFPFGLFFPYYCQLSHHKLDFLKQFFILFHLRELLLCVGYKACVCVWWGRERLSVQF